MTTLFFKSDVAHSFTTVYTKGRIGALKPVDICFIQNGWFRAVELATCQYYGVNVSLMFAFLRATLERQPRTMVKHQGATMNCIWTYAIKVENKDLVMPFVKWADDDRLINDAVYLYAMLGDTPFFEIIKPRHIKCRNAVWNKLLECGCRRNSQKFCELMIQRGAEHCSNCDDLRHDALFCANWRF